MSVTENSSSSLLFSSCHLGLGISKNGPYLLMSDDVRRNRTSDTYYTNSLVKFDANSSVVPLTMYLASKRYGPLLGNELMSKVILIQFHFVDFGSRSKVFSSIFAIF